MITVAAAITEMLDYKMNNHEEQCPPWRRRIEATGSTDGSWPIIGAAVRFDEESAKEVLLIPEALETAKQRLKSLVSRLKRYTREIEGRRINQLYSDIGMSVRLEKCSQMETKRVKVVRTEGIAQPEGKIADTEDSFRCLGIPQANGNHSLR